MEGRARGVVEAIGEVGEGEAPAEPKARGSAGASPSQLAFDRRAALRQSPIVIDATALREAEQYLHAQIPITRAMGVRVVSHDENGFILEAPVALNSNHLRTAFGGSINALATLAAYGLLWIELRESAAHIVIVESSIQFLRPVRETIHAICLRPSPVEWTAFQTRFAEKGKARVTVRVNVVEEGKTAAEFEGIFIARST
jgi:thioesterase domain-containing protein